jgi:hypothetical protein
VKAFQLLLLECGQKDLFISYLTISYVFFLLQGLVCFSFCFGIWSKSQKYKQTTSFLASGEAKAVFVLKAKSWCGGAFPVFCEIWS